MSKKEAEMSKEFPKADYFKIDPEPPLIWDMETLADGASMSSNERGAETA